MKKTVLLTFMFMLLFVQNVFADDIDFTVPDALSDTVDDVTGILSDTDKVVEIVDNAASTLSATTDASTVTVTFNSDGGTSVDTQTLKSGQKASKPASPTRTGYQFIEWTLGNAPYDFSQPVTNDIELVASWASRASSNYTVVFHAGNENAGSRFDTDDGDDNDYYIKTVTAQANSALTKPTDPLFTKDLTFSYWTASTSGDYTDKSQAEYDFNSPVTHDMDLYAVYDVADNSNKYVTVTLHPNGGTLSGKSKIDVRSGYTMDKVSDPKRDNYIFVGWSEDKDLDNFTSSDKFDFDTIISTDMDLYAYWKEGAEAKSEIKPGITLAKPEAKLASQPISLAPATNTVSQPEETYSEVLSADMPKTGVDNYMHVITIAMIITLCIWLIYAYKRLS